MSELSAEQIAAERKRLKTQRIGLVGDFKRKMERGWLYKEGAYEEFRLNLKKIDEQIAALDA